MTERYKYYEDLLKKNNQLNNIIETLEKHLLKTYDENRNTQNYVHIAMQSMWIYNYIQELKGEDK